MAAYHRQKSTAGGGVKMRHLWRGYNFWCPICNWKFSIIGSSVPT